MIDGLQNQIANSFKDVFNLRVVFDNNLKEHQDCVLYVKIEQNRVIQEQNSQIYYVVGEVFINTQKCSFNSGLLSYRSKKFNNHQGLSFAENEVYKAPFTTLRFEFCKKNIQLSTVEPNMIKKIANNQMIGEY